MRKSILFRLCLLLLLVLGTQTAMAQGWRNPDKGRSDYRIERNHVYYRQHQLTDADVRTFVDLGYGYAKDYRNVYWEGRVLPHVDPANFRLKGQEVGRYRVTTHDVFYDDMKTEANPRSFQELGGGYAKDAFDVYYCGKKIKDAFANKFVYLGDGYAEDAFNTYYRGKKVK